MIAWMGQLMFHYGLVQKVEDTTVKQRYRTDQVDVPWMRSSNRHLKLPSDLLEKVLKPTYIRTDGWIMK
jgi:N6-L-threonylcarbamoyladenine synthase/protein kinase Bud32